MNVMLGAKALFLLLIREINRVRIARPPPGCAAMKNAGASTDWIQRAASEINQDMILGHALKPAGNILVEKVLSQHPCKSADRGHHQIDLSHTCITIFFCARPGAIL